MITIQKIEVGRTYEVGVHGVDRIDIGDDGRVRVHRNGAVVYFVAVEGQARLQEQVTYGPTREVEETVKQRSDIPNDSTVEGQFGDRAPFDETLYPEHAKLRRLLRCGNYLAAIKDIHLATLDEEHSQMQARGDVFDETLYPQHARLGRLACVFELARFVKWLDDEKLMRLAALGAVQHGTLRLPRCVWNYLEANKNIHLATLDEERDDMQARRDARRP